MSSEPEPPADVKANLVGADELVKIFRLGLGLSLSLARRLKDRIYHAAQHGVYNDGARTTLSRDLKLQDLRSELEYDYPQDVQYTEEVRRELLQVTHRYPQLTLRQLNLFQPAEKRSCPLGLESCPLHMASLKHFCQNANGVSDLPRSELQEIVRISEQHCELFAHCDDSMLCSDPDQSGMDILKCHHSVPVCPLLRRSWVASEAVRDSFGSELELVQFHELDERHWIQLHSDCGEATQLTFVSEGEVSGDGKVVTLKTEDDNPRIIQIYESHCMLDYRMAFFGCYQHLPHNQGIPLPWSSTLGHLYCPVFAVVNLLSSTLDIRSMLSWPLLKHLHEFHHEHDMHRSDVSYGPCIQWGSFFTTETPRFLPLPLPAGNALLHSPHSVEHLRPSASDASLSFITGVVQRRVTVFRNIASALIKHVDLLKNTNTLASMYGDASVRINVLEDQQSKPPFSNTMSLLRDYLKAVQSDPAYASSHYLQQVDLQSDIPLLMHNAGVPAAAPHLMHFAINESHCHPPSIFIGSKGTRTSLHFDRSCDHTPGSRMWLEDEGKHNLFVQVSGSRKFLLFPPGCRKYMRPDIDTRWGHVCTSTTFLHSVSRASSNPKDQLKYIRQHCPWLAEMWPQRIEVVLKENDALLIPAMWLHCTELLSFSVAVNWWFPVDSRLDQDHQYK